MTRMNCKQGSTMEKKHENLFKGQADHAIFGKALVPHTKFNQTKRMIMKSYSFTEFTGNAALLSCRVTSECMFSTKTRAQRAFFKWIIDLHSKRKPWDCSPTQSMLDNGCRITLTVTCVSKKYLSVNIKPRTISVRNKVLMLWLKTAIISGKKNQKQSSIVVKTPNCVHKNPKMLL